MRRYVSLFLPVFLATWSGLAQQVPAPLRRQPLAKELERLKAEDVQIMQSEAVDEFPLWSPKGTELAVNLEGKWYRVALDAITLDEATWREGRKIAVLVDAEVAEAAPEEVAAWKEAARWAPRVLETKKGTRIELKQQRLSTEFIVTRKGRNPQTLWTTETENCHSLSISPDERFVAFICELNGVIVTQLPMEKQ